MDLGGIIKAPFEDQDWLKKLLLMGVVTFLLCCTVIGIFVAIPNLLGWGVTYGRSKMDGQTNLPEFNFGYIGLGYRSIVASLSLAVLLIVAGIVITVLSMIFGKINHHIAWIPMLLYIPILIAAIPFALAVNYRFVVHDDMMAGFQIGWIINFVKSNVGTLFMAFVIALVVGLISGAMGIVPIVGGMFGMAWAMAANNAIVAEIAKITNRA